MSRALRIALAAVAVLVLTAGLAYAFGKPTAPPPAVRVVAPEAIAQPAGESSAEPEPGGDPSARGKSAPAADPSTPLAIEIPGCVCHSDDPTLVQEHAEYRMNQCAGCHVGGTPTGQE